VTSEPTITVWNPDTGNVMELPVRQAVAGIIAYARREYRAGSPELAVRERRALEILAEHGYQVNGKRLNKPAQAGSIETEDQAEGQGR
jgi:hypothetical protein